MIQTVKEFQSSRDTLSSHIRKLVAKVLTGASVSALVLSGTVLSIMMPAQAGAKWGTEVWETVKAKYSLTHTRSFTGNEYAEIELDGDGSTDLDLFVYSPDGRMVTRSIGSGDNEKVRFWVEVTGDFRVKVKNHGSRENSYALFTN